MASASAVPGEALARIAVVGQTPPPFHGQAIMIAQMLAGEYEGVELVHVRMAFSTTTEEVGRFGLRKLFELVRVVLGILHARFVRGARILYYPPAGRTKIAVLRDMAILIPTRPLFGATIFHFHAAGIGDLYETLSPPMRFLFRRAFFGADVGIVQSEHNPPDARRLHAKREYVIPCGIEDGGARHIPKRRARTDDGDVTILYAGIVRASKGVSDLLEATRILARAGAPVRVQIMGAWVSQAYADEVRCYVSDHDLGGHVVLLGELRGEEKWAAFAQADVFCFPTFYEQESFGIVLLEAMSLGLPVVATRWRATPSIVEEGVTGLLTDVRDADGLARQLSRLIEDPALRRSMGEAGRRRYEERFTAATYRDHLEEVFATAARRLVEGS